MGADAATVSVALVNAWEQLIAVIPNGWAERVPGLIGGVTLVPVPTLNGVWAYGLDAEADGAAALLDRVAASGVPHCLQIGPRCSDALRDLAASRGMAPDGEIPLMALDDARALDSVEARDLAVKLLAPEQAVVHAEIAAAAFEAPPEVFQALVTPAVLATPGVRCYVGELDGEPVATAVSVTRGGSVGIFDVGTLPAKQHRGYGAAITARAVRDALGHGAQWAWLQSSQVGYRVYERLGFRALESWECWIAHG